MSRTAGRGRPAPGKRLAPCSGVPATTRGWSAGSSAPKYRPFLAVGPARGQLAAAPGTSPATPVPRSAIAIGCLAVVGLGEELAAAASIRPSRSGSTPCPVMRKNPSRRQASSISGRRRRHRLTVEEGATSISNGRWVARAHGC